MQKRTLHQQMHLFLKQNRGEATEQDAQEEEPITCTLTVWSPSEDQDPEYGQWLNKVYPLSRTL